MIQNLFFKKKYLANFITLTRVLGVVSIFWLTPYKTNFWQIWAVFIYIGVSATDFLDGWVARKLNIVSDLGKILDPLADKILVLVFLPLLEMQAISSFPVFIILAREYAIMAVRIMSAKQGTIISANISGKIKTAITLPVCGILFARVAVQEVPNLPFFMIPFNELRRWIFTWPNWVFDILIWGTVAITIWSFIDYFWAYIWQQIVNKFHGDEKKAKKWLLSFIPNSFSLLNLAFGIGSAILAGFGYYHYAVIFVIFGIVSDAIDGPLARALDASSKFGATLDSSADFVSFGIAPAVIIFKVLWSQLDGYLMVLGAILALLYYISVQYRLKRFNKGGHTDYFQGLPSPVGAATVLIAGISNLLHQVYIFVPLVSIMSILMLSRIPYAHLGIARKKRFFQFLLVLAFIFMILTILNLAGITIAKTSYVYEILFSIICIYILSPIFPSNFASGQFSLNKNSNKK